MTKQTINVGATANDKQGDSLRAAFQKVNANFTELYEAIGLASSGQDTTLTFLGSTISTDDSSAIVIDQAVTVNSDLSVGGDILPLSNVNINLGSATARFRDLYLSSNTIYLGATTLGVDSQGNLLIGGQAIADVGTATWNNVTGKPTFATVATSGAYGDLSGRPNLGDITFSTNDISAPAGANVNLKTADNASGDAGDVVLTAGTGSGNDGVVRIITAGLFSWDFDNGGDLTAPGDIFGSFTGPLTGDVKGSVFADDSTVLVDGVAGKIVGNVDSNTVTANNVYGTNLYNNTAGVDLTVGTFNNPTGDAGNVLITAGVTGAGGFSSGEVRIRSNNQTWAFNTAGTLEFPGGGLITTSSGVSLQPPGGGTLMLGDPMNALTIDTANGTLSVFGVNTLSGSEIRNAATSNWLDLDLAGGNVGLKSVAGSVTIIAEGGGQTLNWIFHKDNYLQFPDNTVQTTAWTGTANIARNIESENDVSIRVNLSDSTQRIWQFGEDGKLTFPDGANYHGQTVTMPTTTTGVTNSFVWEFSDQMIGNETITLNWNLLAANTDSFYFGTTHSTAGKYLILEGNSQSLSYISNGTSTTASLIFGAPAGNNAGDVNAIELKSTNGDVYLTSTESVKITVDANDSSARVWTFDPTGNLNVPGGIVAEYEEDFTISTSYYALGSPPGPATRTFTFAANGNLTIPGNITSTSGNGTVITSTNLVSLELSTSGYIYIGRNGSNATIDIGQDGGGNITRLLNDRLQILADVPVSSKGSSGDYQGCVAFDNNYIYYCTNAYDGATDIWKRVALTGGTW